MRNRFNPLIDPAPETCAVNGREYIANTDFRVALAFLRLYASDEPNENKQAFGLKLFFGDEYYADDLMELFAWIDNFILCDEKPEDHREKERYFDLLVDSGRILAAFMQVYGINLRKVKMHWWVFRELLDGLPAGTKMSEVIDIRRRPIDPGMKPSDKDALVKLKDFYRLSDERKGAMENVFAAIRNIAGK